MAGRVGQRLAPGERVIYRLSELGGTRDWRRVLIVAAMILAAILIAVVLAYFLADARLLIGLTMTIDFVGAVAFAVDNTTDAAVTDRRLLVVTGWNPTITTEVKPEEIESVEVLRGGLRVCRREGPPVLLVRRRGATELAAALAELAGLPPPPSPGPRDLAAARIMLAGFLTAGYAAALACLALFAQETWTLESVGPRLLGHLVTLAVALAGMLLGALVGLALVRQRFARAEMRAWIEGSAGFAQAMAAGGLCARLARLFLALADRLYGPQDTNDSTGAQRHGG